MMKQSPADFLQNSAKAGKSSTVPLRLALREATRDAHERLHRHPGFLAIQNSTIDIISYRALLIRLLGFYLPFEAAAQVVADRSRWLKDDLKALSLSAHEFAAIPQCGRIPEMKTPGSRLGSLYVVEGAALGGRVLSKDLGEHFGFGVEGGRRFFTGHGANLMGNWTEFLTRLAAVDGDQAACDEIVSFAVEIFDIFDSWMNDWNNIQ